MDSKKQVPYQIPEIYGLQYRCFSPLKFGENGHVVREVPEEKYLRMVDSVLNYYYVRNFGNLLINNLTRNSSTVVA